MDAFNKYTNYNPDAGVSGVVFGAEKPVLEVELNEMQEIQNTLFRRFFKNFIGNCIIPLGSPWYTLTEREDMGYNMTLNCAMIIDGYYINCVGDVIYIPDLYTSVYMFLSEGVASYQQQLYKNGTLSSSEYVDNYIKDSRMSGETSRRKVVYHAFSTSESSEYIYLFCFNQHYNGDTPIVGNNMPLVTVGDILAQLYTLTNKVSTLEEKFNSPVGIDTLLNHRLEKGNRSLRIYNSTTPKRAGLYLIEIKSLQIDNSSGAFPDSIFECMYEIYNGVKVLSVSCNDFTIAGNEAIPMNVNITICFPNTIPNSGNIIQIGLRYKNTNSVLGVSFKTNVTSVYIRRLF